jgi:amino acid adenylation domain-containing protein/non-ribosomal peptide synthase protein (TIGR01720 family)
MTSLDKRIAQLSPAKRALLEKLQAEQSAQPAPPLHQPAPPLRRSAPPVLRPRRDDAPAPLSFAQQRLWFLDQLEPGNPFYNISAAVRLRGHLDAALVERALRSIIVRHDVLRTRFVSEPAGPRQVVDSTVDWSLQQHDLTGVDPAQREDRARRIAAAEAATSFDLAADCLFRAALVRLSDSDHVLVLTLHHVIADGWSMGVVRQELAVTYNALAEGRPGSLPDLPIQYADFAVWQRDFLQGDVLQRQLDYWRDQLGDEPPPLELPTDRPRPSVQTYAGASVRRRLSAELTAKLDDLSRRRQATLFMTLLAGWQTVLGRFAGQDDIAVGSPIANRRPMEVEKLVGFFANTLVLRSDLSGDPTFVDLLAQVRETTLAAYKHQDVPFEKLVEELQPARDVSRPPLVQTMFVLQNIPPSQTDIAGVEVVDVDLGLGRTSAFDATLNVDQRGGALELLLVYNTDLFDATTAERFLSAYETLLAAVVEDPAQPIRRLPIITEAEQRRVLLEWNDTHTGSLSDACLHEVIARQAARTPDAPAVMWDGGELSYRQLDAQSNQLGHYLRSLGATTEMPIGIALARSPEMIVGLLGIFKAGAAYLPLDPNYPPSRLELMCRDAQAPLVVTHSSLVDGLPVGDARCVCLDVEAERIAAQPTTPPEVDCTPENLCYLVYTSGSTGQPKGVEVSHRAVVNHALALADRARLGVGDRMLQYLSLSFDASAEEFFPTLASGAALVMHPAPAELSSHELLELTRDQQINVLHIPPMNWHQIIDVLDSEGVARYAHLKSIITGGESPSPDRLRRWLELTGGRIQFLLAYGVTEATITSTLYEPPVEIPDDLARIPIGAPIANQRVYVLDELRQPVPIGVAGELYLAGVGVARGYRNLPEETSRRFLPDPYSAAAGMMYRTGDRARWLAHGELEFLGRVDHQIKVRGYRIEPGEVQAALNLHPAVQQSLVILREDQPGRRRLVGYVVAAAGEEINSAELREHARERLPEYMVPGALVVLAALPMTRGGKFDRSALPAPEDVAGENPYVAPRDPAEEKLAEAWASVLGLERVGVHDNFFELGGDSILSIQMIARARESGLHLTPKQLFLYQTVAELAAHAAAGPVVVAEQGPISGPVPLTPIQRQFLAAGIGEEHHFNQSMMLALDPRLTPEVIEQSLGALVEHHDALRLRLTREGDAWRQENAPPDESVVVEQFNFASLPVDERTEAMLAEANRLQASLNLATGPLLRTAWFALGGEEPPRLLIAIHHLAVDAVSWRVLLEDLQAACGQLLSGAAITLSPKTTAFRTWSEKLVQYADSDRALAEFDHWRAVADAQAPPLPLDFADGENTAGSTETVECELTALETEQLLQSAHEAYHTRINDLLLTALAQATEQWTGERRLRVDLEGHGREDLFDDVDLSRTVGWFTTMAPVDLELPGDEPGAAIKSVKEGLRAIPQGGVGFGVLRWLNHSDQVAPLRAIPPAPISFNYLGQLDRSAAAAGLLSLSDEPTGCDHSPRGKRTHAIDVIGRVQQGRFQAAFVFSRNLHRRESVEQFAARYVQSLRGLIAHCLSPEAGGFTPSDFPLAGVDDDDLAALSELLGDD